MRAANFSFYVLIYFFLLLNSLLAAPPKPVIFTIGIDPNIKIEDMEFEEIQLCVRDACLRWEETKLVKFIYNKRPNILVTAKKLSIDRLGQYNIKECKIEINSEIYPHANYRKWNRQLLTTALCHELGHSMNLDHNLSSQSIMYFRITEIDRPQPADIEMLKYHLRARNRY